MTNPCRVFGSTISSRRCKWISALLTLAACTRAPDRGDVTVTVADPSRRAAIEDSVRTFAAAVSSAVSEQGPVAWHAYFAASPAFFMASQGQLVFPTADAASQGIDRLVHTLPHVSLTWGNPLRIDVLAPGLAMVAGPYHEMQTDSAGHEMRDDGFFTGIAEHERGGWRLRNAHWSSSSAPSPAR